MKKSCERIKFKILVNILFSSYAGKNTITKVGVKYICALLNYIKMWPRFDFSLNLITYIKKEEEGKMKCLSWLFLTHIIQNINVNISKIDL